jgi:hypothetical protein
MMSLHSELKKMSEELFDPTNEDYLDLYSAGIRQGKRLASLKLKELLKKYPEEPNKERPILNDEC